MGSGYLKVFAAVVVVIVVAVIGVSDLFGAGQNPKRAELAITKQTPLLTEALSEQGLSLGSPIYIRIFKASSELELWVADEQSFKLFKTYPICHFSGELGPKLAEGDGQSPEGFYFVTPEQMNPQSRFHLSFNLGFPNAYDRHHGRTGSFLMVHGNCVSVGCYAMTDPLIEEIYTLASKAFANGQPYFRVHAFPFRMTRENRQRYADAALEPFWQNLQEGYDWFEKQRVPPDVTLRDGSYYFSDASAR